MEISDSKRALFLHDLVEFIYVQALWFVVRFRCKKVSISLGTRTSGVWPHTWRDIMVQFDGDVVGEFGVIDVLENRKTLTDRRDTNLLE